MLPIINICMDCGSTNIVNSFPSDIGYCDDCDSEHYITITNDLLEKLYDFNGKAVDGFQIDDMTLTIFLKDYKPYYDKNIEVELCTGVDAAFIQTSDIIKRIKINNILKKIKAYNNKGEYMTLEELDNLKKRRDEIIANINYHKMVAEDLKKIFSGNEGITINSRYYDVRFSNLVRSCIQFDYEKFLNINTKIENEFLEVDSKINKAEEALKDIK